MKSDREGLRRNAGPLFFFGLALPLELFAFLGLRNRRIALVFGLGLIAFHESVSVLTHLAFIFNKLLLLFLFVSPQWWLARLFKRSDDVTA